MTDQWWQDETEHEFNGETYSTRSRTCGVVWENLTIEGRKRQYRAWVRVQQTSHEDVPSIGMWLWNGTTPAQALSVDEARHLGQALLDAAQLVDDERDAAIRQFLDNTPLDRALSVVHPNRASQVRRGVIGA